MKWLLCGGIGTVAVLVMGIGRADAIEPAVNFPQCAETKFTQDIGRAKIAHETAEAAFTRGDYDSAIKGWREAYLYNCKGHKILVNIARAYIAMGKKQDALEVYGAFFQRMPARKIPADITAEYNALKSEVAKGASPQSAPTVVVTPVPAPAPPPTPQAVAPAPKTVPHQPEQSRTLSKVPVQPVAPSRSIAPLIPISVGAASVVAGAILLPLGMSQISQAEEKCPNRACPITLGDTERQSAISQGNTGRAEKNAGVFLLAAGGAVTAGGLVWQLAFNKPKSASPRTGVSLVPVVAPAQSGVLLHGSF